MPDGGTPDRVDCTSVNGADAGGCTDDRTGRTQNDLDAAENEYCFPCGKMPVQLCYKPDGAELGSLLKSYFIGLKQEGENP